MHLLTEPSSNSKTAKSEGAANYIMHLWPNKIICAHSDDCMKSCLKSAGRGRFHNVRAGRYKKTKLWHKSPERFMELLRLDLDLVMKRFLNGTGSKLDGKQPYVRLNGTSDIPWEHIDSWMPSLETQPEPIYDLYPRIIFYDYTKDPTRMSKPGKNYSLTLSRGSTNEAQCLRWLELGKGNIAAVFEKKLPAHWRGYPVIDGDKNDLRPLDPRGVVVGLKAKGLAKSDTSGFVIRSTIEV